MQSPKPSTNSWLDDAQVSKANKGLTTVREALRTRLKEGRVALSEAESRLALLSQTVQDISYRLCSVAVGKETAVEDSHEQHHIIDLKQADTKAMPSTSRIKPYIGALPLADSHCSTCKPLDAGKPWLRIIHDQCVLGIDVANLSQTKIWDIHIILTKHLTATPHCTKLIKDHPMLGHVGQPVVKKLRVMTYAKDYKDADDAAATMGHKTLFPGQSGALTTTLGLDALSRHLRNTVNLVITFKNEETEITNSISCPEFVISATDLVDEQLFVNLSKCETSIQRSLHDLAAIKSVTEPYNVVIVSKSTDMYGLAGILEKNGNLLHHRGLQLLYYKSKQPDALFGLWMQVQHIESVTDALLRIHARTAAQFFAAIHYLYQCLPKDILMLPASQNKEARLSSAMLKEADQILDFLENSEQEECPNINADRYREFRKTLFDLEDASDKLYAASVYH